MSCPQSFTKTFEPIEAITLKATFISLNQAMTITGRAKQILYLQSLKGVGPKKCRKILASLGKGELLENWDGWRSVVRHRLSSDFSQTDFHHAEKETIATIRECEAKEISIIDNLSPFFPSGCKNNDGPMLLFCVGNVEALTRESVAIIGSRDADQKMLKIAEKLGKRVAQAGKVVVSGLALGVDMCAHKGCLLESGTTVGVLAGGVDIVVPLSNKSLAEDIVACGGALISEFPPGVKPRPGMFAKRNRIQAMMSSAVIVVQAGKKSGTIVTAQHEK